MRRLHVCALFVLATTVVGGIASPAFAAESAEPNLAPNPSFEQLASGKPACWSLGGTAAASATLATTNVARTGRTAATVTTKAGAPAGTLALTTTRSDACAIPVTPGHVYALSVYYKSSHATPHMEIYLRNAKGSWAKWRNGSDYPTTIWWRRIGFTTRELPAGTTAMSYGLTFPTGGQVVVDKSAGAPAPTPTTPPFTPTFSADGLVTNEYSWWNSSHKDATISPDWGMTSGSLFAHNGGGYTGTVNAGRVDPYSRQTTNSAVFRLHTKRADFGDARVDFRLNVARLSSTSATPAVDWDGVHIWMRYQSQYHLYYASVGRRDGDVVIKKKCPGGPSNGGTYHSLSKEVGGYPIPLGTAMNVGSTVRNNADGSVTIELLRNGKVLVTATDTGLGCAPIRAPGSTGIRGDNAEFQFDNFTATNL